jgi:predicted glycoside hydrolase/deacetylase ChbG (UPF0249 family)
LNKKTRTLSNGQTNKLLGSPADARLLIVNADDFGMCHAVNKAIIRALTDGIARSTMDVTRHAFPCRPPGKPCGIHLTAISEWTDYRWGPVTAREKVPSLVDKVGYFYDLKHMAEFKAQVVLDQLEMEFRAHIEVVLAARFRPTHLDSHALRIGDRADIFDVMLRLASEYGLALRVAGRSWIEKLQSRGFPTNDYDFMDSYSLDPANKAGRYAELLHELPVGLTEWAVHPGLDSPELLAIEPGGEHIRQTDFDFLISEQASDVIREEGIILLDYRALQAVWKAKR